MSEFMREFFCWLCCCCPKRSNGVINNPGVNEEMEMLELRKSDVLPQPEQQARASSSSAGDAPKFKTVWVRKSSSNNRGSRSNIERQRRDFYRYEQILSNINVATILPICDAVFQYPSAAEGLVGGPQYPQAWPGCRAITLLTSELLLLNDKRRLQQGIVETFPNRHGQFIGGNLV
ncbi:unnamed protein product [Orchesella dallaii]|uniref:Uncharacterized protein n=1 Tax=Orchesella dallaii TaxID=48710 RepID=A0ABP1S790_9HEXA